ncbi:uroporphyrinogen-III C-methyltransferase [Desulfamplus magnetovallimortis]|uniref:uroporphyrinogen-III C-methyltransferase n=1 Tax=Desulfamplus magnetovallimortis TaxID=1246637 RepID=UPI0031837E24
MLAKKGGDHTMTQDKINELLAQKGEMGHTVARLKGGDPFIFGRGGEEAEVLIERGVPFEIVPGVTSAVAAPAYAGIPLTHRDYTSSVSLITGHEDPSKEESSINWKSFAQSGSTLVFLMGVKNLPRITENLILNGKSPDTPVALVRWGTTTRQESVTGTLETIVENVKKAGLKAPAIIVVGDVVSLRDKMRWFEDRPLFGKQIVVTRARAQASGFIETLTELGATCIEIPTIKVVAPQDNTPLEKALKEIAKYDWIVFTSVNGVKFFFDTLFKSGKDVRIMGHLKCACIGPVTKQELMKHGIVCDVLPESYRAESVIEAFSGMEIKNKNILLPRAKEARSILPEELSKMGAIVEEVTVYITEQVEDEKQKLLSLLEKNEIDMVTFTSSSTVKNFKALLPQNSFKAMLENVKTASIGPITSDTAKSEGIIPDITASEFTIPGLINAIIDYYRNREPS